MPVNYSIPNTYEAREGCTGCRGTGYIQSYVGLITCPLCRDYQRDELGHIVSPLRAPTGELPAFRHELMATTHGQLPQQRSFADGAQAAAPRIVRAGSAAARAARASGKRVR